jgi:DNA repair exonuclease SbcCD ATPase subunit
VNKNIKDIISNQKKDIVNLEGQVNVLNNSKNDINQKLEKLNEDNSSELNAEIDEITAKLTKFIEHEKKFEPALEKLRTSYDKVAKKHSESSSKQYEHKSKIREINEKIDLFNQDICPTCGTDFTSNEFRELLDELEVSKIEQANILSEYDKSLVDFKADMSKIKEKETALRNKQQTINNEIFSMRNRLSSLKNELKKDDTQFDDILAGTIEKIDELLAKIEEKTEEKAIYDKLADIFGEDGIKLQIVKNFLPEFNETINEFCKKLHFPYRIHIDEKFNTRILAIGEDISAKTLSTGETRKANFAVLISLIKIMKKNYPSINLLFLDEILASIDDFSIHEILNLIRDVVDELKLNAFIINHSELPQELFDTVCSVKKVGGFSQMEIYDC